MLHLPLLVRNVSIAGWPSPAALLATIKTSYRLEGSSSVSRSSFSLPGTRTVCQLPAALTLSSSCTGQQHNISSELHQTQCSAQIPNYFSTQISRGPLQLARFPHVFLDLTMVHLLGGAICKYFGHKSAFLQLSSQCSFHRLLLRSLSTHTCLFLEKWIIFIFHLKLARVQVILNTSISL